MTEQAQRVLIVEEPGRSQHPIDVMLGNAGFETMTASGLDEITRALATWRPVVVVVDLPLHDHQGGQILADLARDLDDRIPVILMAEGPNLLKPTPVIPFGLVPKPVDPLHLIAMVRRAMRAGVLTAT
jgi:DNA-binding NtrC family response regulator